MIGQTISHYRTLEKLTKGEMGEVYLAEDTSLERNMALESLQVSIITEASEPERRRYVSSKSDRN